MSRISKACAERIRTASITGSTLLQMFELLEAQMETIGAEGNFTQFQFVQGLADLKEGDLIPEVHLSLRPFDSESIELVDQGEIQNDVSTIMGATDDPIGE